MPNDDKLLFVHCLFLHNLFRLHDTQSRQVDFLTLSFPLISCGISPDAKLLQWDFHTNY